jgi:hypothetical protein
MTDRQRLGCALRCLAMATVTGVSALTLAADDTMLTESRAITQEFATRLQSALQAAMAEGGPTEAISVCKDLAPRIASELSRQTGAQVGRTSLRIRNPRNLPADWQAEILREFDTRASTDSDSAPEYFQRQEDGTVRYMKAIPTGGLCVACHGAAVPDDVNQLLDELYPHDRARGYEPGDIRGAFSIVWPAEVARN